MHSTTSLFNICYLGYPISHGLWWMAYYWRTVIQPYRRVVYGCHVTGICDWSECPTSECSLEFFFWYLYQAGDLLCCDKTGSANRLISAGYCSTDNRDSCRIFLQLFSLVDSEGHRLVCLPVSAIIFLYFIFFASAYVVCIWPQNTPVVYIMSMK